MFNLFKKKNKYPPFKVLGDYAHKDFYFVRCASWMWMNHEHIVVWDPINPLRHITFDPWPQMIFLCATGEKTVSEYVTYVAEQGIFDGGVPDKLDETILNELQGLLGLKIVELCTKRKRPDVEFDIALEKL